MPIKHWNIRGESAVPDAALSKQTGLTPLALKILAARGYHTTEQITQFLAGGQQLSDPFLLRDMEKAVTRIRRALDEGERITVYGDYDCDGMLATVLLYRYFEAVGANICYYIPNRETEGYGLNTAALDLIYQDGVTLLITVDNGISAIEEVAYATRLGLDVVITDHHKPREILPDAVAVVDPHRTDDESDCKCLAGIGVAFKLICALEDNDCDWLLDQYGDLVAVATIADVVPLTGENRLIVRRGLELLQHTENEGFAALLAVCKLEDRVLSSDQIAFGFAPRINAAGRFDRVDDAIELFLSEGERAQELAQEISALNDQRRATEDQIVAQIVEQLEADRDAVNRRVMVVCGEGWHHGVVGIVAARMVERFAKPCVVLSTDGEVARGSARSVNGFSIIDAVSACARLLTRFGGHDQAAGMTLPASDVPAFTVMLNEWAAAHFPQMPPLSLDIDCEVSPHLLTVQQVEGMAALEPFGAGNETPVFLLSGCVLQGIYPIGEGKHLRLRFCADQTVFYAVYFGMTAERFAYTVGQKLDLAATADVGEWNGEQRLTIKIRDLRMSGVDYAALHRSEQLYQRLLRAEAVAPEERDLPDREDIAVVYRYLRTCKSVQMSDEAIYIRLEGQISSLCRLKLAIDVLDEMQLITGRQQVGGVLTLVASPGKVDLSQSRILQALG